MGVRVAAAGAAITAPLLAATRQYASFGDQIDKTSARTGFSAEAISELGFAAEQSGANVETLEKGLFGLSRATFDAKRGSKEALDAFEAIGLGVADLDRLTPDQLLERVADGLAGIEDASIRGAVAQKLMGRAGRQLLPMFTDGAKTMNDLRAQAKAYGLTIGQDTAKQAAKLTDAMNLMKWSVRGASVQIGTALAPMLTKAIARTTKFVVAVVNWIKKNHKLVVTIFKIGAVVAAVGAGLITLGAIITGIGFAISGLVAIAGAVGTAFSVLGSIIAAIFSPVGLIIAGVIAAVVALGTYILFYTEAGGKALKWLSDQFNYLKDVAFKTWQGIGDALAAGDISLAAKILWLSLKMEWQRGVHFLNELWVGAKDYMLKLWREAVYGIAHLINNAWAGIERGWAETVGFLADAWGIFTTMLTKTWHSTIGFVKKAWTRLKSVFDKDINVKAEVERINKETDSKLAGADAQLSDAILGRERERKDRLAQIKRDRAGRGQALEDMKAEQERQRAEKNAAELSGTEAELAQARAEWEAAIAEAAKTNAGSGKEGPGPTGSPELGGLMGSIGAGLAEAAGKVEAKGTFSALAIRGLGADSLAEKQLKTQERIAEGIDELNDRAQEGRLVFAE